MAPVLRMPDPAFGTTAVLSVEEAIRRLLADAPLDGHVSVRPLQIMPDSRFGSAGRDNEFSENFSVSVDYAVSLKDPQKQLSSRALVAAWSSLGLRACLRLSPQYIAYMARELDPAVQEQVLPGSELEAGRSSRAIEKSRESYKKAPWFNARMEDGAEKLLLHIRIGELQVESLAGSTNDVRSLRFWQVRVPLNIALESTNQPWEIKRVESLIWPELIDHDDPGELPVEDAERVAATEDGLKNPTD